MLVVSRGFWPFPEDVLISIDECEGCQVHNMFCKEGSGKMHGFSCHGHFAEYSLADYRNAMVIPDGMDMVTAAPLFCAGVTGELAHKSPGIE